MLSIISDLFIKTPHLKIQRNGLFSFHFISIDKLKIVFFDINVNNAMSMIIINFYYFYNN